MDLGAGILFGRLSRGEGRRGTGEWVRERGEVNIKVYHQAPDAGNGDSISEIQGPLRCTWTSSWGCLLKDRSLEHVSTASIPPYWGLLPGVLSPQYFWVDRYTGRSSVWVFGQVLRMHCQVSEGIQACMELSIAPSLKWERCDEGRWHRTHTSYPIKPFIGQTGMIHKNEWWLPSSGQMKLLDGNTCSMMDLLIDD